MSAYEYADEGGVQFVANLPDAELAYREVEGVGGSLPGPGPEVGDTWAHMNIGVQLHALQLYAAFVSEKGKFKAVAKAIRFAQKLFGLLTDPPQISEDADALRRGKRVATGAGKIGVHRRRTRSLREYARIAAWTREIDLDAEERKLKAQLDDDALFGHLRLAGMNPVLVRRETAEERVLECADRETLQTALGNLGLEAECDAGRIYVVDEGAFAPLKYIAACADIEHPHAQRFVYRPTAVFHRNARGHLDPLTIRCAPELATIARAKDDNRWRRAKLHFQAAESLMQTYVTHQPRTHLLMEAIIIATRRTEDTLRDEGVPGEAVAKFLAPHLEGTLAVNRVARRTLITTDSPFADFIGLEHHSALDVMRIEYQDAKRHFGTFERSLELDEGLVYPFLADFRAVGRVLEAWARGYVEAKLGTVDVAKDRWIQTWANELSEGAHLVLKPIDSRDALVELLATIAKIASIQHAALHYPQTDLGRSAALTAFYAADVAPGWRRHEDEPLAFIDSLPDLHAAAWQAFVLSQNRFVWRPLTKLIDHPAVADQRGTPHGDALARGLDDVGAAIDERNAGLVADGLPPYEYLRPECVPCSINV